MTTPDASQTASAGAPSPAPTSTRFKRWFKWLIAAAVVLALAYACRGEKTLRWEEQTTVKGHGEVLAEREL